MCIAYLSDVTQSWTEIYVNRVGPRASVWFERGWTLQELLAPKEVWFYKADWTFIGVRSELVEPLHAITGIKKSLLHRNGLEKLLDVSIAARMSWAANRVTTRPEDRAYSLIGIFGINMPILYGEGEQNAFFRLQVLILQVSPDCSSFTWKAAVPDLASFEGQNQEVKLLASSPLCFEGLGFIERIAYNTYIKHFEYGEVRNDFEPAAPNSMCVQLWMRPLHRAQDLFPDDSGVFEAYLGRTKEYLGQKRVTRTKAYFTTVLLYKGHNQYQRFVHKYFDLQINDPDAVPIDSNNWVLKDVFLTSPQPNVSNRIHANTLFIQISLDCAGALARGAEIGGFWASTSKEDRLSERYTSTLIDGQFSRFTVRNTKSMEVCGVSMFLKTPPSGVQKLEVCVVHSLGETEFKRGFDFKGVTVPESLNLGSDALSFKLKHGGHLFLGYEDKGKLGAGTEAHVTVGIIDTADANHGLRV